MPPATDDILYQATASGDVPGVVACATDRSGTTYEAAFGKRVLGQAADMTPDTVVWIASMTKAITAQQPEFEAGGGALYGTVPDYLKFVRMMLNEGRADGGEAILKPETVAQMSTNHAGTSTVPPFKTAHPELSNDVELLPGIDKRWGLSFMINDAETPTGRSAGSLGWAGLANSYYWIDQKKGVGGVYATQILPFADPKSMPLAFAFEKSIYDG